MLQLLLHGHAVRAGAIADARLHFLLQAAHADHEELIEIAADNGEKLESLEERHPGILSLFEDAPIEFEPAQLAADVERGVIQCKGRIGVQRHSRASVKMVPSLYEYGHFATWEGAR